MGLAALALFIRFLVFFVDSPHDAARGHIQSLIAGAVLFIGAMLLGSLGVIGDLLDAQRTISQRTFERVRRIELQLGVEPSHYEPGAPAALAAPTGDVRGSGPGRGARPRGPGGMTQPQAAVETEIPTGNTYDKYGSTNPVVRRLMSEFERTLDGLFARASREGAVESLLDVGCGEGVLTTRWAERLGDRRVVGIDLPDPKLEAHWRASARDNLEFLTGTAEELPFGADEFDLACRDRDARARRRPGALGRRAGPGRASPRARVRSARAAVADAERGPRGVRAAAREHPRPRQPLVQARLRAAARASRRGARAALAVPVDDGCWCGSADDRRREHRRAREAGPAGRP